VKTDKYRRLLSCCPSLLDAADKTANDENGALQNNIPAQVTAYVTAPVLFCYVCYILDSVKKNNINRIFFLSRDGYILKQIADIIIERIFMFHAIRFAMRFITSAKQRRISKTQDYLQAIH